MPVAIISDIHGNLIALDAVPFDVQAFIQITLASGMPHAEWAAKDWWSL